MGHYSLCLVVFIVMFAPQALYAAGDAKRDIIRKEKRLEDVKKKLQEEKQAIKAISEKETSVLDELEKINMELAEKNAKVLKADEALGRIKKDISAADARISRLEQEKKGLSARLKHRLKAMYKIRNGEAMKLVFTADNVSSLGRRHKYLTMILDSDAALIARCEENLAELEAEKQKYSRLQGSAKEAREKALESRKEAEAAQARKTALLKNIKHEKAKRLDTVKELEAAARELADLLESLRKDSREPEEAEGAGFGAMRGKLEMPVKGTIISEYGKVKHPKFQTVTFNNGIVIEAPSGTPVKSVYDGKVIYTGWLKGYGQVMILDHGSGYYTLFAYLQEVLRQKGSRVEKGEEVALVGESGTHTSPALYFEIRKRGVPKDPVSWFASR